METIRGRTADEVWRHAYELVTTRGTAQSSRAGDTVELLHVVSEIEDPRQRWILARHPVLNPAFAIAEVIWILAGQNESHVLNFWNRKLPEFAGKGPIYTGAYGFRLRQQFGLDQLIRACDALVANPDSRQVALQLWDTAADLPYQNGMRRHDDVPCNMVALLKVRQNRLEWTQVLRSNDLYRGFPNNVVQFTTLQEIIAGWIGKETGAYCQWSDSLHIYKKDVPELACRPSYTAHSNTDQLGTDIDRGKALITELYQRLTELTTPILDENALSQLTVMDDAPKAYQNLLIVLGAESARRRGRYDQAQELISYCTNPQLLQVWQAWWERIYPPRKTPTTSLAGSQT